MRDLVLACIVFGALPLAFKRPFVGVLLIAWLGYMNPHRLAWGFMFSMPVVQIVVIVTLIGMLASKEAKRMVWSRETVLLVVFILWMGVTTSFAIYPSAAWPQYEKVLKIQILTFVTLLLLTSRERVHLLVWVIVLSLGFYGVKGGIFTILNGGAYRVQGPPGTFIGGNNELALAMVMTIPLMRYLHLQEKHHLVRLGLAVGMLLTAIAAFGTQSRGALVALLITGFFFWIKSRKKFATALFIVVAGAIGLSIMPEAWFERMNTIKSYDEDASALGRINAWWTAYNLANDRFVGGGFELWRPPVFAMYAPDPDNVRDVHSIYFEVLGEHGWVGLVLFLSILGLTWLKCGAVIRQARRKPETLWARDLAAMVQVTIAAYMSAGAFLGLAYFDYVYHLVAIVTVVHVLIRQPQPGVPMTIGSALGSLRGRLAAPRPGRA